MFCAPGPIAAPTKEMRQDPTRSIFRAWKVSDAEEISGQITACTSDSALGTQVSAAELSKLVPMYES